MATTGKEIAAMRKAIAQQVPYQRNDCPTCGWTIEKHPITGQLHCPFDGWTDGLSIDRRSKGDWSVG